MAEVILSGVSKRFGTVPAVSRLSLAVGDGEFVVLLGPTGAGKTTTLRVIAGLERPDEGSVVIAGRDVTRTPPAERDLTFVFQQYSLYPHLSVYDNLAFPLRSPVRRVPEAEIKRKVGEIAELLHISQKLGNRARFCAPDVVEPRVGLLAPSPGRLAVPDQMQHRHQTMLSSVMPGAAPRWMNHSVPNACVNASGGIDRNHDVSEIWLAWATMA